MALGTSRRAVLKASVAAMAAATMTKLAWAKQDGRKILKIAVQDFRPVFEPMHPQSAANVAYRVDESIFDGLLRLDYLGDFGVKPALASSIDQADETTYIVKLRPDVKFHDGTTLTAEDVAFSYGPERLLGDKAPGRQMKDRFLSSLKSAEPIDDLTVRLKTSEPDPVFQKRLATWGGQVISKRAYLAAGSFDNWARAPIGTGPFRVAEVKDKDHVLLKAHDEYWGGKPSLAEVRFILVSELSARVAGLLAGDFDLITDVTPDQIATISKAPGFKVLGGESAVLRNVNLDMAHNPVLRDVNLRRAMSLAIDRDAITKSLWGEKVSVPLGEQLKYFGDLYDPSRTSPAYDPAKARELLAKSAYKGERIPYRMLSGYYTNELAEAQILVAMWQQVGINVEIEIKENWDQVYQQPGTGLNNDTCQMIYPDPLSVLWRCYGDASSYQAEEKAWSNQEFNELGKRLQSSTDTAERKKVASRMLDIFETEDPPAIVLHTMTNLYGVRSGINWNPYPVANMDLRPNNISIGE
ncbi:ABC transporter substrate-binding protein [Mesorhizobium sp.]|uniref:ABC transporter substrate-binding protein n=1 Tax=Mesorhizobium sp. TaxID=1871066 RepID=UPI000FE9A168|nr:ABC transporter substrate-binding protein [Mesorhizobium sp.]RWG07767.1 MAG: ABC transporter substrate-binding protein [Mesorhizobium sp.]RWH02921.1 MAG: ABC transporter substrate-binding protein [Mesorhizobium sp.]RWI16476.1 MAG: ABC transporter substrate-binding protein [Mesorhizobium sp.]RWN08504.1 MAG: ABC transporter substrate-binding protein [Mesorhizobium sp.]RWN08678.1 MAG: ABC transporter substrate-binding protein [Mesorhizobium sp.]